MNPARKTVQTLVPAVLFVIGTSTLIGWSFNIEFLKSMNGEDVRMTIPTALMLILMALGMRFKQKDVRRVVGYSLLFLITILLTVGLALVKDPTLEAYVTLSGEPTLFVPSWGTIAFALVFVYCIFCASCALRGGVFITLLAATATIGHLFHIPALYFYWSEIGSGMASHTVVAAWHVGIWMVHEGGGWGWTGIVEESKRLFKKDMNLN